ncbi:MAG: hypothetical protein HRT92_01450 [Piscirickettsiaceae bacterium]|nr:hypothetical protein [Piscirickettsiaceae bacterium]
MDKELKFPEELSTNVERSFFYTIENNDIKSDNDLSFLIRIMFEFSDRKFYLFCLKSQGASSYVINAEQHGVINIKRTELQYYPHPKFDHDYIKINKTNPAWGWEEEVIKDSPEFIRCTLELTERWKRKLELKEALDNTTDSEANGSPIILKPSIFGIGIDLPKALKWFIQKYGKSPDY